ncbi:MAG TPA: flavin reductase family protein [Acidimicrobiales bacterium]|nr:flavin reductase family protein [Acidimicrobiales bacterium]
MTTDDFDTLMSSLDPAMAVVTTAEGDERAGCLVGFHGQTSIDPPRYGVWLSKANHTYRVALRATHLAVHLLADGDHELAAHFGTESGDDVDKFADRAHEPGPGGVPLLAACPHRLVLRRTVLVDEGGDHVCVTGEVVDATAPGPFHPLRLSQVDDLTPGHDAEERPSPPTERAAGG